MGSKYARSTPLTPLCLPMNVFVAGATGAIGQELVPELRKRGHEVVGIARSDANEATLRAMGATPARADLFDAASLARAMAGCEVVVRVATHISKRSRARASEWAANDRIRREGTRALLDAAKRVGARRYVQESIAWARPGGITQSALDAEALATASGLDAATLRLGLLYGARTAHTRQFAAALRRRMLPVIQADTTPLCFLEIGDAGRAFAAAVEGNASGVFDVVDAAPTTTGAFFDAFARALDAPRPMRVPRWVGVVGAGAYVTEFLTTPMDATNERFRSAFDWAPQRPSATAGIAQAARELTS